MRLYLLLISFFICPSLFSQTTEEILSKLLFTDSIQGKLVVEDWMKGKVLYYLDGKNVDMTRTFINSTNTTVTITKPNSIKRTTTDSPVSIVYISSNPKIKLMPLIEQLKIKGIDSTQIKSLQISIDNSPVLDTNVLLDSRIVIHPVYKGFSEDKETTAKKEDLIGIIIFTSIINSN